MSVIQISVIFLLGLAQGFILTDWFRDKQVLRANNFKSSLVQRRPHESNRRSKATA